MPTLEELKRIAGGELRGDGSVEITGVASLGHAGPGDLAPLDSPDYVEAASQSNASALIVAKEFAGRAPSLPAIVVDFPLAALNKVMVALDLITPPPAPGIHPTAIIDDTAEIGADVFIGPFVVIGPRVRIGDGCVLLARAFVDFAVTMGNECHLGPGAVLHEGSVLGHRVRIGTNAVISRQGFGYAASAQGPVRLQHVGRVVLEDDVHVGACTTIDRARFDETRIGRFSALDNLIQIGHNCTVGERTFVAAQSGLAGHARIGSDCEVGGQSGFANHCGVGDRVRVAAKTGVTRLWEDDIEIAGYPSELRRSWARMHAALRKLGGRGGRAKRRD